MQRFSSKLSRRRLDMVVALSRAYRPPAEVHLMVPLDLIPNSNKNVSCYMPHVHGRDVILGSGIRFQSCPFCLLVQENLGLRSHLMY